MKGPILKSLTPIRRTLGRGGVDPGASVPATLPTGETIPGPKRYKAPLSPLQRLSRPFSQGGGPWARESWIGAPARSGGHWNWNPWPRCVAADRFSARRAHGDIRFKTRPTARSMIGDLQAAENLPTYAGRAFPGIRLRRGGLGHHTVERRETGRDQAGSLP